MGTSTMEKPCFSPVRMNFLSLSCCSSFSHTLILREMEVVWVGWGVMRFLAWVESADWGGDGGDGHC